MESEGPYKTEEFKELWTVRGPGGNIPFTNSEDADVYKDELNAAYAEGRKSAEKEIEEKEAVKDALLCGTGFMTDGKRVPPEDVYLSEAEIKLEKLEKDFKELLELANHMRVAMADIWVVSEEFDAWKKARGIE